MLGQISVSSSGSFTHEDLVALAILHVMKWQPNDAHSEPALGTRRPTCPFLIVFLFFFFLSQSSHICSMA